jgi:hypothetical protein
LVLDGRLIKAGRFSFAHHGLDFAMWSRTARVGQQSSFSPLAFW